MTIQRRIEVTSIETGKTRIMTRTEFFKTFGRAEGKEILAEYGGSIVAVAVAYDSEDTTRRATDCDGAE